MKNLEKVRVMDSEQISWPGVVRGGSHGYVNGDETVEKSGFLS